MATNSSSTSNLLYKPLVILTALPPDDKSSIYDAIGHKELVGLSACCRTLRVFILSDKQLWRVLYVKKFLSGAQYNREYEFILWCIRTNQESPTSPTRRMDILKNVDWYDVCRRRITTESNWRNDYSNIAYVDLKPSGKTRKHPSDFNVECIMATGVIIKRVSRSNNSEFTHYYNLNLQAHPDLKQHHDVTSCFRLHASPNMTLLNKGDNTDEYNSITMGDHYIVAKHKTDVENDEETLSIFTRGHGDRLATINIPKDNHIYEVNGRWALLDRSIRTKHYEEEKNAYGMYNGIIELCISCY
jgi:hypothetical protein